MTLIILTCANDIKTKEKKGEIRHFRQEQNIKPYSKYVSSSNMDYFAHVFIEKTINVMVSLEFKCLIINTEVGTGNNNITS